MHLLLNIIFALETPGIPLIDEPLPLGNQFSTDIALLGSVFLIELPAELSEVPPDLSLLLLRQKRTRTRAPEELFESIKDMFLELLSSEVPDGVTIFELRKVTTSARVTPVDDNHLILTVCFHALALVARYLPLGSHSASVTA